MKLDEIFHGYHNKKIKFIPAARMAGMKGTEFRSRYIDWLQTLHGAELLEAMKRKMLSGTIRIHPLLYDQKRYGFWWLEGNGFIKLIHSDEDGGRIINMEVLEKAWQ